MTNTTTPKPMPSSASKADIQRMYTDQSSITVRRIIQLAIDTVNQSSRVKYTKAVKKLNKRHIDVIVQELGIPPGYVRIAV